MEKINWERLVNRIVLWQWAVITAGIVTEAGIWITVRRHLPPQIPLFYSRPWGEEQLADTYYLWLPLLMAIITATVVTLIIRELKLDGVLTTMLAGAALIAEIILILAILHTVILVS